MDSSHFHSRNDAARTMAHRDESRLVIWIEMNEREKEKKNRNFFSQTSVECMSGRPTETIELWLIDGAMMNVQRGSNEHIEPTRWDRRGVLINKLHEKIRA